MQTTLTILTGLLCLFSLIPLVRKDHWTFRIFEFPRVQKWTLSVALLVVITFCEWLHPFPWFPYLLAAMLVNFAHLSYLIFPFTPFATRQVKGNVDTSLTRIKILINNVYQYNRKTAKLFSQIDVYEPDVILLVETDKWWEQQFLNKFSNDYPHRVLQALDNTYGMLLFSRLPLEGARVRFLIEDDIPSIITRIVLPDGQHIKFYAIHPEPPVPNENPRSTERDAEMLLVGKEAKEENLPVIIAGDLNDVAWSYTTELLLKVSGLLDPRRGRGRFSTFHAKYPLLRWPLDHVFCSPHFKLNRLTCLPNVGSDHLPVFVDLALDPVNTHDEEVLDADEEDLETAEEKIQAAL